MTCAPVDRTREVTDARCGVPMERERREGTGAFPAFRLRTWESAFPGVVCGVTEVGRGSDFATAGQTPSVASERMERLAVQLGFASVAWVRQVHGSVVRRADGRRTEGADSGISACWGEADGLFSRRAGPLLVVTVADCVPAYLLDPGREVLALLHAGWRGTAAGILARGVTALSEAYGSAPRDLRLQLGPAICGECYEVGDEVIDALAPESEGSGSPGRLDLRSALVVQAVTLGVPASRISRSAWCTSCHGDRFYSHRGSGGSAGRMAAFFGWRGPG